MAVDMDGNLYLSMADKVEVISPDGKTLAEIKIQEARNTCFGTVGFSKTLFIAAGTGVYMIETKKEGYNIPFKNQGK